MPVSQHHSAARYLWTLVVCAAFAALLSGCTPVKFVELREKPVNPITERLSKTVFGAQGPSKRTNAFLAASSYRGGDDFVQMLRHCGNQFGGNRHREALHAYSEVSYLAAQSAMTKDRGLAMELCLDAAKFSWQYLTGPDEDGRLIDPNAGRHRETTDIYNTSLQELLRLVKNKGNYRLGQTIRMPVTGRRLNVEIPHPTHWLSEDQLGEFQFVADYELQNLRNRHASSGVGVPIVICRQRQGSDGSLESYYAERMSLPATVVARFPQVGDETDQPIRLQLFDPRASDGVVVNDTLVPLETDISTPLAWFLTNPRMSLLDTFAFLRSDQAEELEGLYMVQPFDPDRIPVLMIHGIWSSPVTWMEMFNDLQSDPAIREKYQFWFYMYPTGQPLTFATASLRDRLKELRHRCDPHGRNARLDQMVVVGHSMGGLMSYLLTVDSEDKLWNSMSKLPVASIKADRETHDAIQRVFFFEADRSVDRIVTIASPFRGSGYANVFTRWLGGSIVWLPSKTSSLSQLIFRQNNQSIWDRMFAPRTSLDSLDRNSAVLRLVSQTTIPDEVAHHNVVGVNKGRSIADWTDGVVKLTSARRDDVKSEVRVNAAHSEIHRRQETIAEVRRVLLQHLKEVKKRGFPVVPLSHSVENSPAGNHSRMSP
ncbi:MAG: alpha/beta hydrolase [Fuerstiella sp.]